MADLLSGSRVRARFPLLWRLPAAWRLLKSPHARRWEKALVVVAALYVVLPFDAIPDLVPFLGWLDDVGVIALAAIALSRALERHSESPATASPIEPVPALSPRR